MNRKPKWNIGNWLKKFKKWKQRDNLYIETNDDLEADVIAECYNTGKTVIKSRDKKKTRQNM